MNIQIIFDFLNAAGLILSVISSCILIKNTYGLEFTSPYISGDEASIRNDKRKRMQKIGLILLLIGFILQLIPAAAPVCSYLYYIIHHLFSSHV